MENLIRKIKINPVKAKCLLDTVKNNRKVSPSTVKQYVADMKNGRWYDNGVPIVVAINDDGTCELMDGQHRLSAVIEFGKDVEFYIAYVPREQAKGYDMNRVRTTADIVRISGCDHPAFRSHQIIAATTLLIKLGKSVKKPSKFEVIETMKQMQESVTYAYTAVHGAMKVVSRAAVLAAIITVYENGYSIEKLNDFINVLISGIMRRDSDETAIRFRNMLMQTTKACGSTAQNELYKIALNVLWNYERDNVIKMLKIAKYKYPIPVQCVNGGSKE